MVSRFPNFTNGRVIVFKDFPTGCVSSAGWAGPTHVSFLLGEEPTIQIEMMNMLNEGGI